MSGINYSVVEAGETDCKPSARGKYSVKKVAVQREVSVTHKTKHRVGDGVTPVALSHHRTCGSAYGGS
ncbi:MAG: hypothetical protein VB138_14460, partial [Burkholderia sp.]